MRFSTAATALWLGLSLPVAAGLAADPPAQQHPGDPAPAAPAAPAPAASTPASAASAASSDAAAKHVKRTECLKEAKAKKLVGADRTSFLNACIAAP